MLKINIVVLINEINNFIGTTNDTDASTSCSTSSDLVDIKGKLK